ncbi:MAG: UDP-N-acetylmuramoyl-L-alanyl-D-glutamate--2,6-diaminopimelate ligase [Clostridiales bacterium]|nr:UDP-N-acetylmuramoyl-L-alanyl-D-glutamate--2,6-diaminopimelate ligase [Clostridiales bacterium]
MEHTKIGDFEVTEICWDNRKDIKKDGIFVCIEGETFDGHSAAKAMLKKGARAVVVEKDLGLKEQILVNDTREALAKLSSNWFSNPEKSLKLIGITGTNGKTTIATTIKKVLCKLGYKTGLIGTCDVEIGDEIWKGERSNPTTPEPYELFEIFRYMADGNCEYVVMEVSSQGLDQKRVSGLRYNVSAFTNLTQDHLDVHGTMENYYKAKKLLFDISDVAVINIDDNWGARLVNEVPCKTVSFSNKEKADYMASDIKLSVKGCEYKVADDEGIFDVYFGIPGEFNVSNSLGVIACCSQLGLATEKVVQVLKTTDGIAGRAEIVSFDTNYTIIRDYAHSPDAVEKILETMRECTNGRVVCLFGCGGNRDAKKRPLMAKAAAKYSDFCIVSSDNPRNEDPDEIIKEILVGFEGETTPYIAITDRREAIKWAIDNAQKDDIIAIVGKGHEDYQVLKNNVKIHFDEKEIVEEILNEINKKQS